MAFSRISGDLLHDFSDLGLKIDAPDLLVHHMFPYFLMGAVCLMIGVTLRLNLFHLSENQTDTGWFPAPLLKSEWLCTNYHYP